MGVHIVILLTHLFQFRCQGIENRHMVCRIKNELIVKLAVDIEEKSRNGAHDAGWYQCAIDQYRPAAALVEFTGNNKLSVFPFNVVRL